MRVQSTNQGRNQLSIRQLITTQGPVHLTFGFYHKNILKIAIPFSSTIDPKICQPFRSKNSITLPCQPLIHLKYSHSKVINFILGHHWVNLSYCSIAAFPCLHRLFLKMQMQITCLQTCQEQVSFVITCPTCQAQIHKHHQAEWSTSMKISLDRR